MSLETRSDAKSCPAVDGQSCLCTGFDRTDGADFQLQIFRLQRLVEQNLSMEHARKCTPQESATPGRDKLLILNSLLSG
jgi:hypothetical protein